MSAKDPSSRAYAVLFSGIFLVLLAIAATVLWGPWNGRKDQGDAKNIVVIVVDTLREDRLDAVRNGLPVMPRLNALAREGLRFGHATSQASWTKPSVVSLFSSLYPEVHDVRFGAIMDESLVASMKIDVVPEAIETMGSFFKRHGYATAAIQTNANLMHVGIERGFDTWFYSPYPGFDAYSVTEKAKELLAELTPPFLLYVHYMDPHRPYDPPERYRELFGKAPETSQEDRRLLQDDTDYYIKRALFELGLHDEPDSGRLSDSGREYARFLYDCEARYVDDQVGHLIELARSLHHNTLVVFAADHGEEFWEHGKAGHGRTLYQEQVHVPLIFWDPDASPQEFPGRVELIDVLPTLAAYAGLDGRANWQGQALVRGGVYSGRAERTVFSETFTSLRASNLHLATALLRDEKLIVDFINDQSEMYDLRADPSERSHTPDLSEGFMKLREALKGHQVDNRSHPLHGSAKSLMPLDEETTSQLEALGYLGSDKTPSK